MEEACESACRIAELPEGSVVCYCDGGADGNGANGVHGAVGWGTSSLRKTAGGLELIDELWGQVEMNEHSDWYCGAERANNNTAELTGIIESIAMLKAVGGYDNCAIAYDSEYAAHAAQGRRGKTNHKLIDTAQRLLKEERERRVAAAEAAGETEKPTIQFVHVFAHTGQV